MLATLWISAALAAQPVTLKTSDGKAISASVEGAKGSKRGVVLLHMNGRSGSDWADTAERFAKSQMNTIAPDLRGHGGSEAQAPELTDADYLAMVEDVKAAVGWLRAQGVEEVSCVGASIGANLCLAVAAEDPRIVNLVLLSPGLNYKGHKTVSEMEAYGKRPVLMVASQDDTYAARTLTILEQKAQGQLHTRLYERAGHGTKMLSREAGLEGMLISWILGTYELANGEVVLPKVGVETSGEAIETTGTKLGAHK